MAVPTGNNKTPEIVEPAGIDPTQETINDLLDFDPNTYSLWAVDAGEGAAVPFCSRQCVRVADVLEQAELVDVVGGDSCVHCHACGILIFDVTQPCLLHDDDPCPNFVPWQTMTGLRVLEIFDDLAKRYDQDLITRMHPFAEHLLGALWTPAQNYTAAPTVAQAAFLLAMLDIQEDGLVEDEEHPYGT